MKGRFCSIFLCLFFVSIAASWTEPRCVVSDWYDHATTAIVTVAKKGPGTSCVYLAYAAVAMFDAAAAVDGRFKPFAVAANAPAGASQDAAVVAAAHDVLVHYLPAQKAALDAEQDSSLAGIANGTAKEEGISVGRIVAERWIAIRANDGLEAKVSYRPRHGPGVWEPVPNVPAPAPNVTPTPVEPWFTQFKPFALSNPNQFLADLEQPYSLDSKEWVDDFNRTKDFGAFNSTHRTPEQTEIGLFWTDHGAAQYMRAIRGLIESRNLNTTDAARMGAMAWVTCADAFAASMSAKYHFAFWRPYTAIRNTGSTSNSRTAADPEWIPLAPTPGHPEYPANHGVVTQALMGALAGFFGTDSVQITFTSSVTHTVHAFSTLQDVVREVDEARIYGGMHYRHSVLQGNMLGKKIASYICTNYFLRKD